MFPAERAIADGPGPPQAVGDARRVRATLVLREDLRWLPAQMQLGSLRRLSWRLRAPFAVSIRKEGASILAEATEVSEFGFGANLTDALADLQATIVELYETLERDRERLGPDLLHVWSVLQEKIEPRG